MILVAGSGGPDILRALVHAVHEDLKCPGRLLGDFEIEPERHPPVELQRSLPDALHIRTRARSLGVFTPSIGDGVGRVLERQRKRGCSLFPCAGYFVGLRIHLPVVGAAE